MNQTTGTLHHRPRFLYSLLTVAFATVLVAGPALAFAPGPDTGNNSPFNVLDAAATCDPSPSPDLNSPTSGSGSTDEDCTENPGTPADPGAIPITVSWISDTLSGTATDNAWGQGDKSDCYLAKTGGVSGACVTQVFGIGAAKTDLQYHGIGLEKGPNGHDYLYSGIKRLQAGGITSSNANYNVEVNQLLEAYRPDAPICDGTNTGGCNIWRSPGDLTFMTDWGGNQSSCNVATPAICAYVWIDKSIGEGKTPSPAAATCFNAKTDPCWGTLPGGGAALSDNPNKAAGSINAGAATQPYTFSEIGIDLTASGLVEEGACETFKNVWAHSRSSSSFSAELKDFIFGNVTIDTCTATTTVLHERASSAGTTDVTPSNNGASITVLTGAYVNDVATVAGNSPTGSVAFKYYPSLGDCTDDTNGTTAGSSSVTSGSATSSTVQFNSPGTFYWVATFTGTGGAGNSASACGDEILTVRQNTSTSTTLHERTSSAGTSDVNPANNGASITVRVGAYVNDVASVTPSGATGTVAFKYYPSLGDCTNDTNGTTAGTGLSLTSGSATSSTVQFNSVGTFYWKAVFSGSGLYNSSASACGDEILTVQQVNTAISTAPWYYPNDSATVTAPSGGGDPAGSVKFRLYDTAANCTATTPSDTVGQGGLLYKQAPQNLPATAPFTVSTNNSTVKVTTSTTVWWLVEFTSTNPTQIGRNSVCVENIAATLTGDTSGTAGNSQ